jgi:glycosyltransferase involved in cell wall biosynthesis
MRILLLSQFDTPVVSGETRHVIALSRALAGRGHDVSVVSLPHPEGSEVLVDQSGTIESFRGTVQRCAGLFSEAERPHAASFPHPELALEIGNLVAEMKPDVVHGHNWISSAFLPSKSRSRAGFVVTLHDYSLACAKNNHMRKGLSCSEPGLAKCMSCGSDYHGPGVGSVECAGHSAADRVERRIVDRYIAVSRAVAKKCNLQASRTPFDVLPTFIPDDLGNVPQSNDARLDLILADGFILFVGDLTRGKGVPVLLEAYALLPSPPPLVLIGRVCHDTPRELPAGVSMFEDWPHATIMRALKRCLFGVAPSVWPEACGTIVMEGNAVGKTMIASASGGLSDLIVDGKTGFLVPPADPQALACAMRSLIENPVLRETMASAGRRHVERFMEKSVVPKIERIYRDICVRSPTRVSEAGRLMSVADGGQ